MNEITPTLVEGELRIRDVDLAARLGFGQARDIRRLIARHGAALSRMGPLPTMGIAGQGEQAKEFRLNRKQAI
jgi:hypothetical protein